MKEKCIIFNEVVPQLISLENVISGYKWVGAIDWLLNATHSSVPAAEARRIMKESVEVIFTSKSTISLNVELMRYIT